MEDIRELTLELLPIQLPNVGTLTPSRKHWRESKIAFTPSELALSWLALMETIPTTAATITVLPLHHCNKETGELLAVKGQRWPVLPWRTLMHGTLESPREISGKSQRATYPSPVWVHSFWSSLVVVGQGFTSMLVGRRGIRAVISVEAKAQ